MIMYHDFEKGFFIQQSGSKDPTLVHIRVQGGDAPYFINKLIAESQPEANDSNDATQPPPFEFAGLHAGMPKHEVWAITRDGSDAQIHLEAIVERLHQAYDRLIIIDELQ